MKFKVYSTVNTDTVKNACIEASEYFGGNVILPEITFIKPIERKKTIYEVALSWARMILKKTKSISTDYIMSLDHEGYDGVILFVDKSDARESSSLMGQHSVRNGKSYIEIYDTKYYSKWIKAFDKYGETTTRRKEEATEEMTTRTLKHEIFHALSSYHNIDDILHAFIAEGQFDSYLKYLQINIANQMETNSEKLYKVAMSCLKTDVTPKDEYPDSVSCAITVNVIHQKAFGDQIGGTASTYWMYNSLLNRKDFQKVDAPQRGDIIISPTGYAGKGGTLTNGHVGIVGDGGVVLSNNSNTGLLDTYFTIEKWNSYYGIKGKFPIYYFRKK